MSRLWFLLYVTFTTTVSVLGLSSKNSKSVASENKQRLQGPFMYFAYGSNLLKKRIKINSKSAQLITSANLPGWRLDFNRTVEAWNGAVATITPHPNSTVWGNLWLIAQQDLEKLDSQEGLHLGWYDAISVTVNTPDLGPVEARTYVQPFPPAYTDPQRLPTERQPSLTYFKVILYGAMESNLPVKYLKQLEKFPNNGKSASTIKLEKLGYPFCDHTCCGCV